VVNLEELNVVNVVNVAVAHGNEAKLQEIKFT
jgi:hypothetical protein